METYKFRCHYCGIIFRKDFGYYMNPDTFCPKCNTEMSIKNILGKEEEKKVNQYEEYKSKNRNPFGY